LGAHKVLLDSDLNYDFDLIAIHCSLEPYRVAYMLNMHLTMKLARKKEDIAVFTPLQKEILPSYEYITADGSQLFTLVCNKAQIQVEKTQVGLFSGQFSERATVRLLPELGKVDYLLKVEDEGYAFAKANCIAALNAIPQIITAYELNPEGLRQKENLIFE